MVDGLNQVKHWISVHLNPQKVVIGRFLNFLYYSPGKIEH